MRKQRRQFSSHVANHLFGSQLPSVVAITEIPYHGVRAAMMTMCSGASPKGVSATSIASVRCMWSRNISGTPWP